MTDTLRPTPTLIADADRALHNVALFGARYRADLQAMRNKLRGRCDELLGRLTNADQMYPHGENDPMPPRHEDAYLDLLEEYERAHDALKRANTGLNGG